MVKLELRRADNQSKVRVDLTLNNNMHVHCELSFVIELLKPTEVSFEGSL